MSDSQSTAINPQTQLKSLEPFKLVTGLVGDLCRCMRIGAEIGGDCCETTGWTAIVTVYLHANRLNPKRGDPLPSTEEVYRWIDAILEVTN